MLIGQIYATDASTALGTPFQPRVCNAFPPWLESSILEIFYFGDHYPFRRQDTLHQIGILRDISNWLDILIFRWRTRYLRAMRYLQSIRNLAPNIPA